MPVVYAALADFWGLSWSQTRVLWSAITRSRWSETTAFRAQLTVYDNRQNSLQNARHVLHEVCAPPMLFKLLENLCQEGVLKRQQVNAIESRILEQITSEGHWNNLRLIPDLQTH